MAQLMTGTTPDSRVVRVTARTSSAAPGSPMHPSKFAGAATDFRRIEWRSRGSLQILQCWRRS